MADSFIEFHYNALKRMFPNADPEYLESIAIKCEHDEAELYRHIEEMSATGACYPTIEERIERMKDEDTVAFYTKDFNVETYLRKFPDRNPRAYFSAVKTENESGKSHADFSLQYLAETFPRLSREVLQTSLKKHKYCLVDTVSALRRCNKARPLCKCGNGLTRQRSCGVMKILDGINTAFLDEVVYIEHEDEIEDYISTMAIFRDMKIKEAKEEGMLCQCGCCFDTEILVDETFPCTRGHLFCETCLMRYVDTETGEGRFTFPCMSGDCTGGEISLTTLETAMDPKKFSSLIRRKQLDEMRKAGIEDVESCPFCGFMNSVDGLSRTFLCLDDQCRKESCRQCKKESHTPYECNYLEKSNDRTRKYVEDTLSSALIRKCYNCRNPFVKENTGCNHMTCPGCQSHMCYVCRQPLDPARIGEHFAGQGSTDTRKCPLFSDANLLHVEALGNVARALDKEIRKNVPTADINVADFLPENIRATRKVIGAPEHKDLVLSHTMKAAGLK